MPSFMRPNILSFSDIGKIFDLTDAPLTVTFRNYCQDITVNMPDVGKRASGLGFEIETRSATSFVFVSVAPAVLCTFTSDSTVSTFSVTSIDSPPAIYYQSGKNAIINSDIFENWSSRLKVIGYDIGGQTYGPSYYARELGAHDIRLTVDGKLTICTYIQVDVVDVFIHLEGDISCYVRVEFNCVAKCFDRPSFRYVVHENLGTFVLGGLKSVPSLLLADSLETVASYESTPAYATVATQGDDGISGTSIVCTVKLDAVGSDPMSLPYAFAVFKDADDQEIYASLAFPIKYASAVSELVFSTPCGFVATDLRTSLGFPIGSTVKYITINGLSVRPLERYEEHLAITDDLTLVTMSESWAPKKYDVFIQMSCFDGSVIESTFTVKFNLGDALPAKSTFVTHSSYDAFIPVSQIFPFGHAAVEFVFANPGISIVSLKSDVEGGMRRYVRVGREALSTKTFGVRAVVNSVELSSFTLTVETNSHLLSSSEDEFPAMLGENYYSAKNMPLYAWLGQEIAGKTYDGISGCFQAGSEIVIDGICTICLLGYCIMVDIDPLNASKVPKIRYAWKTASSKDEVVDGWSKMKFKLKPLASSDNMVGHAGQTITIRVQDNDYNPSKVLSTVTYSVNDGPFEVNLNLTGDKSQIQGTSTGMVTVRPLTSFVGQAFSEKIVARMTSEDGSVEDVTLTATFIDAAASTASISYVTDISTSVVTRGKMNIDAGVYLKNFIFRGRSYSVGSVAYFPDGLVSVDSVGTFMFSPNLSTVINSKSHIGDIYCYSGVSGTPHVLSLQYANFKTGPYFVRGNTKTKIEFNLRLPEGVVISEYRSVSTPGTWTSAGNKLSYESGYIQISKHGKGAVKPSGETFTSVVVRVVSADDKTKSHITSLQVLMCDNVKAAKEFPTYSGNLLTDKPKGSKIASYSISKTTHTLIGTASTLGNSASFVAESDGSYGIWVSSAYVGEISVDYRYEYDDISMPGTLVICEDVPVESKRSSSPAPVLIVDTNVNTSKDQQVRAAISGTRNTPGRRSSSPVKWQTVPSYAMYPDGTILPQHVVDDAGADHFESLVVGDRVAFKLKSNSAQELGGAIFRPVAFELDTYCQVAGLAGLVAELTLIAGAVDVALISIGDLAKYVFSCVGGKVTMSIESEVKERETISLAGVFRKSANEPEFFHKITIDVMPIPGLSEVKFNPANGFRVVKPCELFESPVLTNLGEGVLTNDDSFETDVEVTLPGGVYHKRVNFVSDKLVTAVADLKYGLDKFVVSSAKRLFKLALDVAAGDTNGAILKAADIVMDGAAGHLDAAELIARGGSAAAASQNPFERLAALQKQFASISNAIPDAPAIEIVPEQVPAPMYEPVRHVHKPATRSTDLFAKFINEPDVVPVPEVDVSEPLEATLLRLATTAVHKSTTSKLSGSVDSLKRKALFDQIVFDAPEQPVQSPPQQRAQSPPHATLPRAQSPPQVHAPQQPRAQSPSQPVQCLSQRQQSPPQIHVSLPRAQSPPQPVRSPPQIHATQRHQSPVQRAQSPPRIHASRVQRQPSPPRIHAPPPAQPVESTRKVPLAGRGPIVIRNPVSAPVQTSVPVQATPVAVETSVPIQATPVAVETLVHPPTRVPVQPRVSGVKIVRSAPPPPEPTFTIARGATRYNVPDIEVTKYVPPKSDSVDHATQERLRKLLVSVGKKPAVVQDSNVKSFPLYVYISLETLGKTFAFDHTKSVSISTTTGSGVECVSGGFYFSAKVSGVIKCDGVSIKYTVENKLVLSSCKVVSYTGDSTMLDAEVTSASIYMHGSGSPMPVSVEGRVVKHNSKTPGFNLILVTGNTANAVIVS
jgi:hypothetical protein